MQSRRVGQCAGELRTGSRNPASWPAGDRTRCRRGCQGDRGHPGLRSARAGGGGRGPAGWRLAHVPGGNRDATTGQPPTRTVPSTATATSPAAWPRPVPTPFSAASLRVQRRAVAPPRRAPARAGSRPRLGGGQPPLVEGGVVPRRDRFDRCRRAARATATRPCPPAEQLTSMPGTPSSGSAVGTDVEGHMSQRPRRGPGRPGGAVPRPGRCDGGRPTRCRGRRVRARSASVSNARSTASAAASRSRGRSRTASGDGSASGCVSGRGARRRASTTGTAPMLPSGGWC